MLSRGPSGDQIARHMSPEERAEEEAYERKVEEGYLMCGSGTTTNDNFEIGADGDEGEEEEEDDDDDDVKLDESLADGLENAEVRDWARRVSGDELKTIDILGKGNDGDPP